MTPRTIRYYEQVGLLQPERRGQRRVFHERDRVRLRLVLRGRRLGFNLSEIAEMIDLYDGDPSEARQLRRTLEYGRQRITELVERRREITALIEELRDWERKLERRLASTGAR